MAPGVSSASLSVAQASLDPFIFSLARAPSFFCFCRVDLLCVVFEFAEVFFNARGSLFQRVWTSCPAFAESLPGVGCETVDWTPNSLQK